MTTIKPDLGRLQAARVLFEAGIIRPINPLRLARTGIAVKNWGLGVAGGFEALEARVPDKLGLIDDLGSLTFGEIAERANRLATSLHKLGVGPGDGVAIMCRNHRGFVDAAIATAKLGADMLLLNTAFAGPQLAEVVEREKPTVLVYDQEFEKLLSSVGDITRVVAWTDGDTGETPTLEQLIEQGGSERPKPPPKPGRIVILTSGTTGTPKGAPRSEAGVDAAVALLSRMPIRRGWRVHIAAPLFHTWGLAHFMLAMLMETSTVLTRKFDPEQCLRVTEDNRCEEIVVIPVMLQRIMRLPEDTLAKYDLSHVEVVAASGSALAGDLATDWMDHFGDNLYNTYGSTEVAYATIATPEDLRAAPGTAGKPPLGTVVKLFDPEGKETPTGEPGRIFVGNGMLFEGYTGGGHKDVIDGLMSSGDIGRFDDEGRLFVEGRDDDMIVSGGENVFPQEVEDCLARHDAVVECACLGVDDDHFGKRLRAFVVLKSEGAASEDDLKDWVKSNLARYKVPRDFVFLDELPRNATGKVLKRELEDS